MPTVVPALARAFAITAVASGLACCATAPGPDSPSRLAKASCNSTTGSRIAPPSRDCLNVPGRSYSRRDIEGTGVIDPAQALRMLDPSVTGGR